MTAFRRSSARCATCPEAGARLKVASIVGIPDSFQLAMDDGRKFACSVVWRTEAELGVAFAPS